MMEAEPYKEKVNGRRAKAGTANVDRACRSGHRWRGHDYCCLPVIASSYGTSPNSLLGSAPGTSLAGALWIPPLTEPGVSSPPPRDAIGDLRCAPDVGRRPCVLSGLLVARAGRAAARIRRTGAAVVVAAPPPQAPTTSTSAATAAMIRANEPSVVVIPCPAVLGPAGSLPLSELSRRRSSAGRYSVVSSWIARQVATAL